MPHSPPCAVVDSSPLFVRSAGVKTYMYHWLDSLQNLRPGSVRAFPWPAPAALNHSGGVWRHPAALAALQVWNRVPQAAADRLAPRCDVFHASNLLRCTPRGPALSATLHDLTAWLFPEFHTAAQVAADREFADRVLRPAAGLIAVSEATRADAIRILRLPPEKIRTIYPGVPPSYRGVARAAVERVAAQYALPPRYFLFTGTVEPRKNLDTLLDAWMSLPASFRREHGLVLAGMPGWKSHATRRRVETLYREGAGIRRLGYVKEESMPGLTAGALALVYPSRYEGFGIPVAQAMAAGCPVVTSNVSSLPEVAGGAALLVDPLSQAEIAAAMRHLAESPTAREKLAAAGLERSRIFTWPAAAELSCRYFDELAGRD